MRYGIGEWYGKFITDISAEKKIEYAQATGINNYPCPFLKKTSGLCNKAGGVCTLAVYNEQSVDDTKIDREQGIVTICPNRFREDQLIFKEIGKSLLDTETPFIIKEVPFLRGVDYTGERLKSTVGRIDMVLAKLNGDRIENWAALEMQAVYFSGTSMKNDFKKIQKNPRDLQYPAGNRRPDFRSSGPKRLMPQLQTKVPSLRRWGKKIGVIIDYAFFKSIAPMTQVDHLTNADIVWFICDYDNRSNQIQIIKKIYTTLESSVEGLTAGVPVSKVEFEKRLSKNILKGSRKVISVR